MNSTTQDIGARRLQTILEVILEDISFNAPEKRGAKIKIDRAFVQKWFKVAQKNEKLLNNFII